MTDQIKGEHPKPFDMMPAPVGTCPECACKHESEQPHNQQSLFYQYHFFNEHGRWPTWKDALEHCPSIIKELWIKELTERGIDVNGSS
jgi:hypothetical protein